MSPQRNATRHRLIQAALQLFAAQGMTETTTRQIAELAGVNEVTLFRHFGNKHGLILAVLEDAEVFKRLSEVLSQQARQINSASQAIRDYSRTRLQALEQIPEFVRSLVGEAGQYPVENRQALGHGLMQANRYTAQYLATVMLHEEIQTTLPPEKLASLLNGFLLGYAVLEFTSEFHELWRDREEFLDNLVMLFLHGAIDQSDASPSLPEAALERTSAIGVSTTATVTEPVADLPASLVRRILQRAKKLGQQDYALAYVLFGAGLTPQEIAKLERSHSISDSQQHLLQVSQGPTRQVPLNQWIMGHRYGSHPRNPLTQWLKSRKDDHAALFLGEQAAMSEAEIRQRWQMMTEGILAPSGQPVAIEQAEQTWLVEMLMKGMALEDMSILTRRSLAELEPFACRAREKAALEQAVRLDQKPGSGVNSKLNSHEG